MNLIVCNATLGFMIFVDPDTHTQVKEAQEASIKIQASRQSDNSVQLLRVHSYRRIFDKYCHKAVGAPPSKCSSRDWGRMEVTQFGEEQVNKITEVPFSDKNDNIFICHCGVASSKYRIHLCCAAARRR